MHPTQSQPLNWFHNSYIKMFIVLHLQIWFRERPHSGLYNGPKFSFWVMINQIYTIVFFTSEGQMSNLDFKLHKKTLICKFWYSICWNHQEIEAGWQSMTKNGVWNINLPFECWPTSKPQNWFPSFLCQNLRWWCVRLNLEPLTTTTMEYVIAKSVLLLNYI